MRFREFFNRFKNESLTEGITAFHSSGVSTISKFNSFSHFGTEAAAVDRIRHLVNQKRLNPDGVITIYSIDLNIKKPLMIKDANANHSAGVYAMALRDAKIIDQDTMVRIRMNNPFDLADPEDDPDELAKLWPKYEKNNLAFIKKALKSKGYDGLVYKNNSEDKGSLSYVILDPNQARITGKKQVGIKDFIKKKQTTKNPNSVVKKVANPNAVVKEESKLLDKPTLTVGELAEKYKTSLLAVEQQLKKGIKVEMEHTKKHSVAKEIALDHLAEDLYYYEKLAKIEKTNEGQFRSQDVEEWKPSKEQLRDLKSKYLPDWEMLDHRILQAEYTAKDHRHADKFTKIINKISEEMDHFCEVTQDVAEVTVKTTTSDVKGLTLLDFEIAMRIDAVAKKMDIEQIRSKGNFDENFADGRNPQDKGDSGRHGIPKGATIAQLKKIRSSDSASPRKKQLAHWQINMRQGKKKGS